MNDATLTPQARASRRRAIRQMAAFVAGSPLLSLVDANGDPVQAPQIRQQGQGSGRRAARPPLRRPVASPMARASSARPNTAPKS